MTKENERPEILDETKLDAILSSTARILERRGDTIGLNALRKSITSKTEEIYQGGYYSDVSSYHVVLTLGQNDKDYIIDKEERLNAQGQIRDAIQSLNIDLSMTIDVIIKCIPKDTGAHKHNSTEIYITDIANAVASGMGSEVFTDAVARFTKAFIDEDHALVIAEAKNLTESFAKHIIDHNGDPSFPQLIKKCIESTFKEEVIVESRDKAKTTEEAIARILSSLYTSVLSLNALRGIHSGHGKGKDYKNDLGMHHARLAAGSAILFMDFILESRRLTEM